MIEYAPCGTLWDRIATGGQTTKCLAEEEVRWWSSQLDAAISWVHAQGYAHRDVKPQNCLLYLDGSLKLTDFGSAAPLQDITVAVTHCHLPVGTPDYIAPEILTYAEAYFLAQNAPPYTSSVDWWSLGVTVFELLAGLPPFFASSISTTYERILALDYVMPEMSPDLADYIKG